MKQNTILDQMFFKPRTPFSINETHKFKCVGCQKVQDFKNSDIENFEKSNNVVKCECGTSNLITSELTETIYAKEFHENTRAK